MAELPAVVVCVAERRRGVEGNSAAEIVATLQTATQPTVQPATARQMSGIEAHTGYTAH